ncbi:hypothetical protein [Methanosphaera sp.]
MNRNIKRVFLITTLLFLLVGLSALSAADVTDSNATTTDSSVQSTIVQDTVSDDVATTSDTNIVEKNTIQSGTTKETKTIKNDGDSTSNDYEVNESTFDSYFTDNTLNLAEGSTLTFTSDISRSGNSYIINTPVNIIGNDHVLNLDSSSLNIMSGASNSNITGLSLVNTQVFVNASKNVVFDDINVTVNATDLGMGVGSFAIREGSGNITVKNSDFTVNNNGGYSLITITYAENCTITDNTITATGTVGNLIYLNFYNANSSRTNGVLTNRNNTISNNVITGPTPSVIFCYAIALSGNANKVINNTIDYTGYAITTSWIGAIVDNTTDPGDNHTEDNYNNQIINNTVQNSGKVTASYNTTITGNTFSGIVTAYTNNTLENNQISGTLTLRGSNITVTNNTLANVIDYNKNNKYNNISYNTMDNLTIKGSYNNITYNTIDVLSLTSQSNNNLVKYNNYTTVNDAGSNTILDNQILGTNSLRTLKTANPVVYITNDNFNTYFYEYADDIDEEYYIGLNQNKFAQNTTYYLDVDLVNKDVFLYASSTYLSGVVLSGVDGRNYNGSTFRLRAANTTLRNMNYRGSLEVDGYSPYVGYSIVENVTVSCIFDDKNTTSPIRIGTRSSSNITALAILRNCTFNVETRAFMIDWGSSSSASNVPVLIENKNVTTRVYNNTFNIQESYGDGTNYETLYAMEFKGNAGQVTFENNTVNLFGSEYMYGIVLRGNAQNYNIINNNITINSTNYTCGIKLESQTKNNLIQGNIINCTSSTAVSDGNEYTAYGIYCENWNYYGGSYSATNTNINNNIINNTIYGTGYNVYGFEGYGVDQFNITGNTIIVNGVEPEAIGVIGTNINITNNTIKVTGTSTTIGTSADYLKPLTTGIQVLYADDAQINITENTITTTSGRGVYVDADYVNVDNNTIKVSNYTYSVELKAGSHNNVTYNHLKTSSLSGDNSVSYTTSSGNLVEHNDGEIPKSTSSLTIDVAEAIVSVDDPVEITVNLTDSEGNPVNGAIVTITVGDDVYNITTANGIATYNYTNTTEMRTAVQVKAVFEGNDDYEGSASDIVEVDIEQIGTTITLDESYVTTVNNQTVITGTLVDDSDEAIANAVINVTIGETSYTATTNDNGVFTVNYTPSTTGTFDISAVYAGDNKYTSARDSSWIDVEPIQLVISLETSATDNLKVNDEVTITGTLTDEYGNNISGKSVTISINGEEVATATTDNDGKYTATITVTTAGDNLLTIDVAETDGYTEAYNDTTFNVNKIETILTVNDPVWAAIGDDVVINGTLSAANGTLIADATIIVTIDGNKYTVNTDENGAYTYSYTTSEVKDNVVVTVEYAESDAYLGAFNDTFFDVEQVETVITIDELEPAVINETVVISGKLTEENSGNAIANAEVTVTIGETSYTATTNDDGEFAVDFTSSTVGTFDISAVYAGNTKYTSASETSWIDVEPIQLEISLETTATDDVTVSDEVTVTGTLTDELGNTVSGKSVIISINGEEVTTVTTDNDGKYTATITVNAAGDNLLTVDVAEADGYTEAYNDTTFTVNKMETILTVNEPLWTVVVGNDAIITGTLSAANGTLIANADIIVTIDGNKYTVTTDENGVYTYNYATSEVKDNVEVTVEYAGNDVYVDSFNDTFFDVEQLGSVITINEMEPTIINKTVAITGKLTEEFTDNAIANAEVTVTIGDNTYTVTTDNDGVFTVDFTSSTVGTFDISAVYAGNITYTDASETSWIDVEPIQLEISLETTATDDVTVGDEVTVTGTLTDELGNTIGNKQVTISLNDEEVTTVTTDNDGKYTATITVNAAGDNLLTVDVAETDEYTGAYKTTTLIANKMETILTVNEPLWIVTVGDDAIITGTLSAANGTLIANAEVIVTIDGNKYTVTTDENGVYTYNYATSEVKNNVEVTVEYAGNDVYVDSFNDTFFDVEQLGSVITIDEIDPVIINNTVTVSGKLTEENTGKAIANAEVSVTLGDNTYTVTTNDDGIFTTDLTAPETTGTYTISVVYAGNTTYDATTADAELDVEPQTETRITLDDINVAVNDNVTVSGKLAEDDSGKAIAGVEVTVTFGDNTYTVTTNDDGTFNTTFAAPTTTGTYEVTVNYPGNNTNSGTSTTANVKVDKASTIVVVDSVVGVIGEKITLTAHVTDNYGNNVTGGNLVFKLNGKTLRSDGSFNSTAAPLKFSVVNGLVTYTLNADLYLRNAKNLSASYSGSSLYEANASEVTTAQIAKRRAAITVTTDNLVKQDTDVKLIATLTDVTKNGQNTTAINEGGYVIFKVNGVSLKDANGKIIRVKVENNTAVYTYHVPAGMASVDGNGNLRNYSVEAVYQNEIFYPDTRNTTVFNVEKSTVKVNINSVTLNNKTKVITSIKANLTDANGNLLVGTNKVCVKVNGKALRDSNNKTMYFTVTNGIINLTNIKTTGINTFKNITIVTGERQAYTSGQSTTTKITVV